VRVVFRGSDCPAANTRTSFNTGNAVYIFDEPNKEPIGIAPDTSQTIHRRRRLCRSLALPALISDFQRLRSAVVMHFKRPYP
jgi:hypothetical protein